MKLITYEKNRRIISSTYIKLGQNTTSISDLRLMYGITHCIMQSCFFSVKEKTRSLLEMQNILVLFSVLQ